MKVLLVGGAGHVGSFITPYLRQHHDLRVLDLRPPTTRGWSTSRARSPTPTPCAGPWRGWTPSSGW